MAMSIDPLYAQYLEQQINHIYRDPARSILMPTVKSFDNPMARDAYIKFAENKNEVRVVRNIDDEGIQSGRTKLTTRVAKTFTRKIENIYRYEALSFIAGNERNEAALKFMSDNLMDDYRKLMRAQDADIIKGVIGPVTIKGSDDAQDDFRTVDLPQENYIGWDYSYSLLGAEPDFVRVGLNHAKLDEAKRKIRTKNSEAQLVCVCNHSAWQSLKSDPMVHATIMPVQKIGGNFGQPGRPGPNSYVSNVTQGDDKTNVLSFGAAGYANSFRAGGNIFDMSDFTGQVYMLEDILILICEACENNIGVYNETHNDASKIGYYAYVYDKDSILFTVNDPIRFTHESKEMEEFYYTRIKHRYDVTRLSEDSVIKIAGTRVLV